MCRVSVIVPVYQVEAYLPRCLESILAQTFRDFELILVDDGTRDGCPAIMEAYAQRDARIRCIRKENGGLSSARNAGLSVARGEFIAFVDSDDYVEPDMLADAVAAADESAAELVIWNYRLVDEAGVHEAYLPMRDEVIDLEALGLHNYFYRYWMPYVHGQEAWCRLYRREIIEREGLRYAPNREIFAEDTLFSAMYLMHVRTLAALAKPYVYYVQRGGSLMAAKKPQLARRLMCLSVRLSDYVKQTGREKEMGSVLPVLCYDKLICKGIRLDPELSDVLEAMEAYGGNATMRALLKSLLGVRPLLLYTLKTGKGIRSQVRARMFAARWLRGDVRGAAALVQGREDAR
ncbi:MAG: glycosyltransferase family 2 protein [Clostridia bacterium]|nr:glycosyltransferase family 2 protein [Clostridia bacterium]